MKGVQCYELFGGIALKNHTFSFLSNIACLDDFGHKLLNFDLLTYIIFFRNMLVHTTWFVNLFVKIFLPF